MPSVGALLQSHLDLVMELGAGVDRGDAASAAFETEVNVERVQQELETGLISPLEAARQQVALAESAGRASHGGVSDEFEQPSFNPDGISLVHCSNRTFTA